MQFKSIKKGNEVYKFSLKHLQDRTIENLKPEIFFLARKDKYDDDIHVTLLNQSGYYKKAIFNAKSSIYFDFDEMYIFSTSKNIEKHIFQEFVDSLITLNDLDLKPLCERKELLEKIRLNIS